NHAAAGIAGVLFGSLISGDWMRWLLGLSFVGVAVWALFPDSYEESPQRIGRVGAFTATLVAVFLAEIRDKTQIAAVRLPGAVWATIPGRARHDARHVARQYSRRVYR